MGDFKRDYNRDRAISVIYCVYCSFIDCTLNSAHCTLFERFCTRRLKLTVFPYLEEPIMSSKFFPSSSPA